MAISFKLNRLQLQKMINLICLILPIVSSFNIDLLCSTKTELSLISSIETILYQNFEREVAISNIMLNPDDSILESLNLPSIVIDITNSISLGESIKMTAEMFEFIYLRIGEPSTSYGNWEFFTHIPSNDHYKAFLALVNYLEWSEFMIISKSPEDAIVQNIKINYVSDRIQYIYAAEKEDQELSDYIVGRQAMPTGLQNIAILNDGVQASKIVTSLKNKYMYKAGAGVIVGSRGAWIDKEDGLLIFIESGLEESVNSENYEALSILKFLKFALKFSDLDNMLLLREFLEQNTQNHCLLPEFVLVNIKNSQRINVGTILNGILTLTDTIVFPGNILEKPNSSYSTIAISYANGTTEPEGYSPNTFNRRAKMGAVYAAHIINRDKLIGNFVFEMHGTDCGVAVYDPEFAKNCFAEAKDRLGSAFLPSLWDTQCTGTVETFNALDIKIPIISDLAKSSKFGSTKDYPKFMRIAKELNFNGTVLAAIIRSIGWNKVAIIHSADETTLEGYNFFLSECSRLGIEVVNMNNSYIDTFYTKEMFEDYKSVFQDIMDSRVRGVLLYLDILPLVFAIESFYDVGARRGDIVFIINYRISGLITYDHDSIGKMKYLELVHGSFSCYQAEYIGAYGEAMKAGLEDMTGPSQYTGFSFDAAMLAAHGIDYAHSRGINVEDSDKFNSILRMQRFTGVTGTVSITSNTNNRSNFIIYIYNLLVDEKTNDPVDHYVGNYEPGRLQLLILFTELTWPDGTTNVPSQLRPPFECPFDPKIVIHSDKGRGVMCGVLIFVFLMILSTVAVLWRSFAGEDFEKITARSPYKIGDAAVILWVIIDMFQFIAMGPALTGYDIVNEIASSYLSAQVNRLIQLKGHEYWIVMYVTLSFCIALIASFVYVLSKIYIKFNNCFFENCTFFARLCAGVCGNVMFLPIVAILLSMLDCDEGIGSELTDSFLTRDCYTFCWTKDHFGKSLICLILVVIYIPLTLYCHPIMQIFHYDSNIKVRLRFLLYRGQLQVTIVVLSMVLRPYHHSIHGFIFTGLMIAYMATIWKWEPFNYNRLNFWALMSITAVIWDSCLASIYYLAPSILNIIIWTTLLIAGWIIIAIFTFFYQKKKIPGYLYTEKGMNIGLFFKFAFTKFVSANDINMKRMSFSCMKYEVERKSVQAQAAASQESESLGRPDEKVLSLPWKIIDMILK